MGSLIGSLSKNQIEYLKSLKNSNLLQYMSRWRMVDDLKKFGIVISDSFWIKKEVVRDIYKVVLDSIDLDD